MYKMAILFTLMSMGFVAPLIAYILSNREIKRLPEDKDGQITLLYRFKLRLGKITGIVLGVLLGIQISWVWLARLNSWWLVFSVFVFYLQFVIVNRIGLQLDKVIRGEGWSPSDFLKLLLKFQFFLQSSSILLYVVLVIVFSWVSPLRNLLLRPGVYFLLFGISLVLHYLISPCLVSVLGPIKKLKESKVRDGFNKVLRRMEVDSLELFFLQTGGAQWANALVVGGIFVPPKIYIIDAILENLAVEETIAILIHEAAHVQNRTALWEFSISLVVLLLLGILLSVFSLPALLLALPYGWLFVLFPLLVYRSMVLRVSRWQERRTDKTAAGIAGGEAYSRALTKLHKLNYLPLEWGKSHARKLTHPSLHRRLTSIGQKTNGDSLE